MHVGRPEDAEANLIKGILNNPFDYRGHYNLFAIFCKTKKWNKKTIIIALILSVFFNIFFYKTCISFFNEEIGYSNSMFGPALNTYWTRLLELKQSCPPGPPCHVYATIPEDPTTAFFLNLLVCQNRLTRKGCGSSTCQLKWCDHIRALTVVLHPVHTRRPGASTRAVAGRPVREGPSAVVVCSGCLSEHGQGVCAEW